ncbi:nuclear transport factor 2 family protein [Embleya sp. NPDC001921]
MSTNTLIADRIEIADLFSRFARLLDDRRWEDADTVFADDVTLHTPRGGGGEIRGLEQVVGFLRRADAEAVGEYTQHVTTDLLVDVDGDRATASANSLVYFYREGRAPHLTSGLRLTYTVVRTAAGWRLHEGWTELAWRREN